MLIYNMMTWYNLILTPHSLWPVWADTDMSENVVILSLAQVGSLQWVSEIDHDHELWLDKVKPRLSATRQNEVAETQQSVVATQ